MHTHTHTCTHKHAHTHTHANVPTYTLAHTHTHTTTHTQTHAHTHTLTHTHTHTQLEIAEELSIWESFLDHVQTFMEGLKFAITGHTLFMAALTALATFFCAKGVLAFS